MNYASARIVVIILTNWCITFLIAIYTCLWLHSASEKLLFGHSNMKSTMTHSLWLFSWRIEFTFIFIISLTLYLKKNALCIKFYSKTIMHNRDELRVEWIKSELTENLNILCLTQKFARSIHNTMTETNLLLPCLKKLFFAVVGFLAAATCRFVIGRRAHGSKLLMDISEVYFVITVISFAAIWIEMQICPSEALHRWRLRDIEIWGTKTNMKEKMKNRNRIVFETWKITAWNLFVLMMKYSNGLIYD